MDLARMPLEEIRDLKLALSRLLDSEGWKAYCEVLNGQIRARKASIIEMPIRRLDDGFEAARLQGELAGLQGARVLVDVLIDELAHEIKRREESENAG